MSSTPDDGESIQRGAEGESYTTHIPNETTSEISNEPIAFDDTIEEVAGEEADAIPQLDETLEEDIGPNNNGSEEFDASRPIQHDSVGSVDEVEGRRRSPSLDESVSIPDDLPSARNSGLSSPSSGGLSSNTRLSRQGSGAARRPFELRFQSRLSSSYFSPRASSPAFLAPHSRHTSITSLGPGSDSALDDTPAPWEVIRWARLKKLTAQAFSEVARRNFGSPTCLAVGDQIVIGTTKGLVLVFDHQQINKAILGSGTKAAESGAVTSLAISADHTTVAVGHASGQIFTWEISRPARPFLHVPPVELAQSVARKSDGHIDGSAVLHIGFIGYRRTALVSADDKGMAFSHLFTRGTGALRSVRTTRILGRYPDLVVRRSEKQSRKSSVLAFSPLPLGNVEQRIDTLGLVAMLTPYLLVIVSTTPVAQTQHKSPRPKEVAAHSAMTAALAWFPAIKLKGSDSDISKNKLAYAWSNVLTILELEETPLDAETPEDKPVELQFFSRNRYVADEAIVAVQWLSRSVIAALTITQQLLIIEDGTMNMTDTSDLLPKSIYHADLYSQQLDPVVANHDEDDLSMHGVVADAYHMSFRSYKGRLFLLGTGDLWWGALSNWADRLLAMMEVGNFIGAIRLATTYYSGVGEKATIGLPEDATARSALVRDKLLEMISASLRYVFGKNEHAQKGFLNESQQRQLASACIEACLQIEDRDFLLDDVYGWYEESGQATTFLDVLEPRIVEKDITILPPSMLKTLINHFSQTHSASQLEEIICSLDATTMDIDQVTNLCKQHNLYDAYIYVWNSALQDYVTPLQELLEMVQQRSDPTTDIVAANSVATVAEKVFPYLSFVLTSRVYPTGEYMSDEEASHAKAQIYEELFYRRPHQKKSLGTLTKILQFDAASFMAAMNEAFEDTFLNTAQDSDLDGVASSIFKSNKQLFNRQIIVRVLLEVMSVGFDSSDTIFLDMFIARNLPKYPQYMLLSGTILTQVLTRLCRHRDQEIRDDVQLSIEYLLSIYQPAVFADLIPSLEENKFWRILKIVYRQEKDYAALIRVYLLDDEQRSNVFAVISDCLSEQSTVTVEQKALVVEEVKRDVLVLAEIDVAKTAIMFNNVLPHELCFGLDAMSTDQKLQFNYLRALFESSDVPLREGSSTHVLIEKYMRLMCKYDPSHLVDYINTISHSDLRLTEILPEMELHGTIDAAVVLMTRQGQVKSAMERLIQYLSSLGGALKGMLLTAIDTPDEVLTNEAIEDTLDSVDKYTKIGIWLCRSQGQQTSRSRPTPKSPQRSSTQASLSFEETLWLDLLVAIVNIMQSNGPPTINAAMDSDDIVSQRLRSTIQTSFTSLLDATSVKRHTILSEGMSFLRILRAFLSRAAETSPSLSHLRHVLSSVFSAYAYEESLLSLSNTMLDKDLFVQINEVNRLRRIGWRPRGQVCELCKKRAWGPSAGLKVWEDWEAREKQRARKNRRHQSSLSSGSIDTTRGKGKAVVVNAAISDDEMDTSSLEASSQNRLVVFSCRHLYHKECLDKSISSSLAENGDEGEAVDRRLRCPLCQ